MKANSEVQHYFHKSNNPFVILMRNWFEQCWSIFISGALCLLFVSSGITIAVPFSLGKVIDIIQTDDPEEMKKNLRRVSTILLGLFCVGGLANFGRVYLISVAGLFNWTLPIIHLTYISNNLSFFNAIDNHYLIFRSSNDKKS